MITVGFQAPGDIENEYFTLTTLGQQTMDNMDCLKWLAKRRLIHNHVNCRKCGQPCTLVRRQSNKDGHIWQCRPCGNRQISVRADSFFSRSHLSLQQLLLLIYCWADDLPQNWAQKEANVAERHTMVDWWNFCRDVCVHWVANNHQELGGIDDDGQSKTVEIDESFFFHRKYARGQVRPGHWVFGGIERGSLRCFAVDVPNRRKETLEALLQRYILPGTRIVSDGWPSYVDISVVGGGLYMHDVVIHEEGFVHPLHPDVHTNNVENMWMRAKRKLRRQFGTSEALFTTYLDEFVWRSHHPQWPFVNLLSNVTRMYDV